MSDAQNDFDAEFETAAAALSGESPSPAPVEPGNEAEPPVEALSDTSEGSPAEPSAEPSAESPEDSFEEVVKRLRPEMTGGEPPAEETKPAPGEDADVKARAEKLDAIRKEWPEVNELLEAEVAPLREANRQLTEALQQMQGMLSPVVDKVQQASEQEFLSTVRAAHSDVDSLSEPLVRWIDGQPGYLKAAYLQALYSPEPQDAIDLLTRFKKETGRALAADSTAAEEPVRSPEPDPKLRLLKQPQTRRAGVIDTDDPFDYEAAFEKAAASLSKTG